MTNRTLLGIVLFFWLISTLYLLTGAIIFSKSSFEGIILITSSQLLLLGKILLCLFYIFPRYWKKNKVIHLIVSITLLVLLSVTIRYYLEEVLFVRFLGFPPSPNLNPYFFVYDNFYFSFPGIFIGMIAYLVAKAFDVEQKNKQLRDHLQQAELNFLKSQLNPHFLYNTLNYMYAIALPISDKLSLAILKLSNTMRYTLTQNKKSLMPLSEEIQFIEDYIKLHAIQFEPAFYHHFSIEGNTDQIVFPPLVLVPFIENAIKHGITNVASTPIEIRLVASPQQLIFEVSNYINQQLKDEVSGIGLANVQRRLEILYPDKHTLLINNDSPLFKIKLTVNLQ